MHGCIRDLRHTTSLQNNYTPRDGIVESIPESVGKVATVFSNPLIDRKVMTRFVPEIDLPRARNFLLGVQEHLFPLRNPAGSTRNREQNGKHGHRETHRLINEAGVEIHVGIELALHEVFVFESDALALESDFQKGVLAHKFEDFVSDVLDDAGARIVILVNAMAESHELDFTGFDALDELGNFLYRADLHEHVQNFFIGAAMERAVERSDGRGGSAVGIDVGAAHTADGVCGAVLLVVGMQDEENVERALQGRVRPVLRFGSAKEHVEKVARIAEVIVRINERHAQGVAIRECCNRRNLSDETIGMLLGRLGAKDVFRVVVEGGKGGVGAGRAAIGMRGVVEPDQQYRRQASNY